MTSLDTVSRLCESDGDRLPGSVIKDVIDAPIYRATISENGQVVVEIESEDSQELESAILATVRELNKSQHERNDFTEIRVCYI
jgi:hypothetical protein